MHPVLTVLHIGAHALPIFSYGVFLCLGLAVAGLGAVRVASRAQLDVGACIAALGIATAGGFAGAWLLNGLVQTLRLGSLAAGFARPGIAFFGGAIGAGVSLLWACRRMRLPGLLIVERALPAVAFGHALGRIGCLLGGCCFGRPTTGLFAVHYLDPRAPAAALWLDPRAPGVALSVGRHPVPLYEALALALLALVFALRPARRAGDGARLLAYAASYSALRIGLEFLRGDEVRGVLLGGALSTSQIVAGFVLLGCGLGWSWYTRASMRRLSASVAVLLCLGVAWRAGAERFEPAKLRSPAAIHIGAGWFTMGSDDADVAFAVDLCKAQGRAADSAQTDDDAALLCRPEQFADEQPQHRVFVGAFLIDRTEVAQSDYQRCVQADACSPPRVADIDARVAQPEQPANGVTSQEAARYCAWVGGRLPTEAEWERAARGSGPRRFPWGSAWNSRVANHGASGGRPDAHDGYDYAAPVGALRDGQSAYGLLNMAGNAWEMTADRYDREAYTKSAQVDPHSAGQGDTITIRGGSWRSPAYTLRVTQRATIKLDETRPDVGFRCAYNVP